MNQEGFIRGLLSADQHRGGIRCLRLFRVAAAQFSELRVEIEHLRRNHPGSSVGDSKHVTHWTDARGDVLQHSLLNRSGSTDDFGADHNLSCRNKWFFDAVSYPTLGRLIADWPHLVNVRINALGPAATLTAHEEHVPFRTDKGTVGARLRFHLPVETHPEAELNLDGQIYHLDAATVHLVNQGCVHAARNGGATTRVHIVWDSLLTVELFRFLFEPGAAPEYLHASFPREIPPLREAALGPYRRLPTPLSATEAADLALCDPQ